MEIYYATEGNDDEAVALRLLAYAGLKAARSPGAVNGKAVLDGKLPTYARTARTIPWLILRDLDHDAPCPGRLIENLIPDCPPLLVLRIAVRAIESWLLADDIGIADYLGVPHVKVPRQPEQLDSPKMEMVNLARYSRLPAVRRDMVPEEGGGRIAGKAYTQRLVTFAREHWNLERARGRSSSLDRSIHALARLQTNVSGD
ncbi:MAG TPA: hypothetical protein VNO30_04360 [Kofleriaceae bacterium]|nr:hypothetical protein [Kofleriaceae bacterium]